jgi:hypothetical protein
MRLRACQQCGCRLPVGEPKLGLPSRQNCLRYGFEAAQVQGFIRELFREVSPHRNDAVEQNLNHRRTQMDTDVKTFHGRHNLPHQSMTDPAAAGTASPPVFICVHLCPSVVELNRYGTREEGENTDRIIKIDSSAGLLTWNQTTCTSSDIG